MLYISLQKDSREKERWTALRLTSVKPLLIDAQTQPLGVQEEKSIL